MTAGTGGIEEAAPIRRRRGSHFFIESEYEQHNYVAIQHGAILVLMFSVFVFVKYYQGATLKQLTLHTDEYLAEGEKIDPWLIKWTDSYIDGDQMFREYVTIGCSIAGIGSIVSILGFVAYCYQPIEGSHSPISLVEFLFLILLFGFGVALFAFSEMDKIIFYDGEVTYFLRVVEGDTSGEIDVALIDPVDNVPHNTSAYCSDSMHPALEALWPECPPHYAPAQEQVQSMMDSGEYDDRTARQAMGNVTFCEEVGICPGCNDAGLACKEAVKRTVLLAQKWDGVYMFSAAIVGVAIALFFFWWHRSRLAVEAVVERMRSKAARDSALRQHRDHEEVKKHGRRKSVLEDFAPDFSSDGSKVDDAERVALVDDD